MGIVAEPLGKVLDDIDRYDPEATIYVKNGPVEVSTEAIVVADSNSAPSGFRYLLEVFLAHESLGVWSKWRKGKRPSTADRVAAVAYYASHDAYLPAPE